MSRLNNWRLTWTASNLRPEKVDNHYSSKKFSPNFVIFLIVCKYCIWWQFQCFIFFWKQQTTTKISKFMINQRNLASRGILFFWFIRNLSNCPILAIVVLKNVKEETVKITKGFVSTLQHIVTNMALVFFLT